MPTELSVSTLHESGLRFASTARSHTVVTDYPLQVGEEGAGMRPLELLLASLASCAGGSMTVLLRKMKQPFRAVDVNVRGLRRDEHPTCFTEIALELVVRGKGLDPAAVARALAQSEESICPVWAMLKSGTAVRSSFRIVEE